MPLHLFWWRVYSNNTLSYYFWFYITSSSWCGISAFAELPIELVLIRNGACKSDMTYSLFHRGSRSTSRNMMLLLLSSLWIEWRLLTYNKPQPSPDGDRCKLLYCDRFRVVVCILGGQPWNAWLTSAALHFLRGRGKGFISLASRQTAWSPQSFSCLDLVFVVWAGLEEHLSYHEPVTQILFKNILIPT